MTTAPQHSSMPRSPRYAELSLREDETIIAEGVISSGIYWKAFAVLVLAIIIGLKAWQLGVFLGFVTFVMFVMAALTRKFLLLILTNHRVIVRFGIMNLDTIQIRFSSIESVEVKRTLIGQFLGYGIVAIRGTGTRSIAVPFVANAVAFRDILDEVLYRADKNNRS